MLSIVNKLPLTRLGPGRHRGGLPRIGRVRVPVLAIVAMDMGLGQMGMRCTPASMLQKPVQHRAQPGKAG